MSFNLTQLLTLVEEIPAYLQLIDELKKKRDDVRVTVLDVAKPYIAASLYYRQRQPMLMVTAHPENAKKLYEQILPWCNPNVVRLFPEPEALPYERIVSSNSTIVERLRVLASLANIPTNRDEEPPPLIISSTPALTQKLPTLSQFIDAGHTITVGIEMKPFDLLNRWQTIGYQLENLVEVPGTISHRGGIIDIYPPNSNLPARLEFFGDTVESIRLFDPISQRSLKTVPSIMVTPTTDLLQGQTELFNHDCLLNYLPQNSQLLLDEPESIRLAMEDLDTKASELRTEMVGQGKLPVHFHRPYFIWEEIEPALKSRPHLTLTAWGLDNETGYELGITPASNYAGQLPTFTKKVKKMLVQAQRLILVSQQANRLSELLETEGIIAPPLTEIKSVPPPGSLTLLQGSLTAGWMMAQTSLFTDTEIFGFTKQRRSLKKYPVPHHKLYINIKPSDYVVHIEHGIARFAGVTTMSNENGEKEYLTLEYAASDKLYVPTDQIDRVTRYVGAAERPPVLSRLGTQEWSRVKQRVKESVVNVAEELLALYAARGVVPGFAFSPDTVWQQELESAFPHVETIDQIEAIKKVKEDMEKTKPMDRLVCGDVGYGKTEVAIRAAFKAVMDDRQVAVLVPTTVLSEQHFTTFSQRLAAFPLKVEALSRFRSHQEQKIIIDGLADGTVDICIGTHRLLQKDVVFKNLGLLIIDEEQRFGVTHKEYLKKKRQEVDVLTLSATPIPRTLHMSLVSVRDMSVMETPPEERLPIKTYFTEYNDRLVRDAILRELERNGQIFFVHNRVQSIVYIASKLQELVPRARITIGHGQMPEDKLEKVMTDFVQGKTDVLVCTSIIESGLDMPNVNTMIINNADRCGLTQLYQLRGRVGRGTNLAYAYFLYERGKRLTPTAEKRLRTIFEATEMGAGFGIAMKDLEIRGAGTMLGVKQSGHISAVGFNLYTQLLAQAVEELKAKKAGKSLEAVKASHLPPPTISLPLPAYIPEDYVTDINTRISLYQKLTKVNQVEQIENMSKEFTDRFGAPPRKVKNLLYALKIKVLGTKASIESISTEENQIVIRRLEGIRFDKSKLDSFLKTLRLPIGSVYLDTLQLRLIPKRIGTNWQAVLEKVVRRVG